MIVKTYCTNQDGIVGKMCIGYKCEEHWCPLNNFYHNKCMKDGYQNRCKDCKREQLQSPEGQTTHKKAIDKYNNSAKGKKYHRDQYIKNKDKILKRHKEQSQTKEYKRIHSVSNQKYRKTKNGKLSSSKGCAKRQRNLGYEELFNNPFPKDIPVIGHHMSDGFVVYIPKSLHLNHYGPNHREELKPYIESIYDISYTILEGKQKRLKA